MVVVEGYECFSTLLSSRINWPPYSTGLEAESRLLDAKRGGVLGGQKLGKTKLFFLGTPRNS